MDGVPGGWHPSGTGFGDLPADQFGVCGGNVFYQRSAAGLLGAVITMLFPLVARCDNTIGALFKMGIAMALRNVMPVLAALMVTVAFFAVGVFVFWPVLLVAPGLASYCNAFLFNRIFDKYGMTLE